MCCMADKVRRMVPRKAERPCHLHVRVSEKQFQGWVGAWEGAKEPGESFSDWVRRSLEDAAKRGRRNQVGNYD